MPTRFEKTKRHVGPPIPFVGDKGDDTYEFDIPFDEELVNVKLEHIGGKYNPGARLEQAPKKGAKGPDQIIRVHWWFDGGPAPPGSVRYRVRAFTRKVDLKNMIVCPIENTRAIPMPDLGILPREVRVAVEAFISRIAEAYEEANVMSLLSQYYDEVILLCDSQCTKSNICEALLSGSDDYRVDLTFVGHGSENSLMMYGGDHLTANDITDWKERGDFADRRLGLVYMMNCHGKTLNNDWLNLGFETSIGPKGLNFMPEPMFSNFWTRYRNGESAALAAENSWKKAKEVWSIIFPPKPVWVRTGPMPWDVRLELVDHKNIKSSRPVVGGNGKLKINTTI